MEKSHQLSIIILAPSGGSGLLKTLQSIAASDAGDYKIYVLSNPGTASGSPVCPAPENAPAIPEYTPIHPPKALTAGGLYNYALTKIDTPYVMFMKEQDTLEPAFISACLEALRDDDAHMDTVLAVGKSYISNPIVSQKVKNTSKRSPAGRFLKPRTMQIRLHPIMMHLPAMTVTKPRKMACSPARISLLTP